MSKAHQARRHLPVDPFDSFTAAERAALDRLRDPVRIQSFLDSAAYRNEDTYHCPRTVLRERRAHCFDGGLFAAAALRRIGYRSLIVELVAERDDDHILAVFRDGSGWGAVAKSNFVGLRYRPPVYRDLRELVMSYFEPYFNLDGERTLRSYTLPVDLSHFDHLEWMTSDVHLETIAERLDRRRRVTLLTPAQVRRLPPVDERSHAAGLMGSDPRGLYGHGQRRHNT